MHCYACHIHVTLYYTDNRNVSRCGNCDSLYSKQSDGTWKLFKNAVIEGGGKELGAAGVGYGLGMIGEDLPDQYDDYSSQSYDDYSWAG